MASHRRNRTMRGALAATAVAVALSLFPTPALAQDFDTKDEAVARLQELHEEAVAVTEELHQANDELEARREELREATEDAEQATRTAEQALAEQETFRDEVDQLASASYQGARFNKLSALLVADDPEVFLQQLSALDVLANGNRRAMDRLSAVVTQASDAEQAADEARAAAEEAEAEAVRIESELGAKQEAMDAKIAEVQSFIDQKEAEELQVQMPGVGEGQTDYGQVPPGSGTGAQAANVALGKQGTPYVYGATGPGTFDCSGLVQWAYAQVGIGVPRNSRAQAAAGVPVSRAQLAPGDIIAYGSPVHHVSMYVGGGNVVHAPTTGDVVKVVPIDRASSSPVTAMRRVA
ncbi:MULTISPECIES: C40 family peptidase [Actinoalloteichus]|nr:NlpC/P60 family protein [Actinoalloteichus caeruleus]